jgi:predicted ribosome quality control (RQC) complex YloA/Tae2 family protein
VDADLSAPDAVALVPIPLIRPGRITIAFPSWREAAAWFLLAKYRGSAFEALRRDKLEAIRRTSRRLRQLESHLERDLAGLPDEAVLRRRGEALLAFVAQVPPGAGAVELPDPWDGERRLSIALDPRLSPPANADRLFDKARRIERSRRQVASRLQETRTALTASRAVEDAVLEARDLETLRPGEGAPAGPLARAARKPLHFLSARGLSILVGKDASENHHLTFAVARPEDLWLHARDVPGGHVILRDPEGRAGADDIREAAEVAAFFSEARRESAVDVHVTRRKHLRPARGGAGRVHIHHSDTVRVAPRDPQGRLRARG